MVPLELCFATFDVVTCYPDDVNDIDPEQINKEPEVDIVSLANTVRNEGAVMVEILHTDVACSAVNRALRPNDHAREAEL